LRAAPEFAWVFVALPYCAALGLFVALLAAPGRILARHERAGQLALAAAAGLSLNYALGTLLRNLDWVLLAGCAIAVVAVGWALLRRRAVLAALPAIGWARWLVVLGLLGLFAGPILFEPVQGWDARSIWFFAAKRIFFAEGLDAAAGWTDPAYGFGHSDYPKLLPLLAAQFAHAWGFWNEYTPKAGVLVLLAPVLFALMGLARRMRFSVLFLIGALLLVTKEFMWNGYVDAYLCLYGAVSMLYVARWLSASEPLDLAIAGAFLGVAVNLKNEGALLAVSMAGSLVAWMVLSRQLRAAIRWRSLPAGAWVALALPLVGFAAWALTKQQWQLANDLQLGAGSLQRVLTRIGAGELSLVAHALVIESGAGTAAALFAGTALLAWLLRARVPAAAWFPAAVATLYFCGIFLVYLATPHGLAWHLATSADRTMLLAVFGFFGSTFLVLEAMESAPRAAAGGVETTGLQT
jgi:hypothetical protein